MIPHCTRYTSVISQEKGIQDIVRKKYLLDKFICIRHVENLKVSAKKSLEIMCGFSNVMGYQIILKKKLMYLYTKNEQLENII